MFEKIKNNSDNRFSLVTNDEIQLAEKRMNILIPFELKEFYRNIGCGLMYSNVNANNRLIDPLTCADIRLREDFYEFDPDLELYESFEKDKMIFFEINEGVYALIEISNNKRNKIYFGDEVIANSLEEFLEKIGENPDYWTA